MGCGSTRNRGSGCSVMTDAAEGSPRCICAVAVAGAVKEVASLLVVSTAALGCEGDR